MYIVYSLTSCKQYHESSWTFSSHSSKIRWLDLDVSWISFINRPSDSIGGKPLDPPLRTNVVQKHTDCSQDLWAVHGSWKTLLSNRGNHNIERFCMGKYGEYDHWPMDFTHWWEGCATDIERFWTSKRYRENYGMLVVTICGKHSLFWGRNSLICMGLGWLKTLVRRCALLKIHSICAAHGPKAKVRCRRTAWREWRMSKIRPERLPQALNVELDIIRQNLAISEILMSETAKWTGQPHIWSLQAEQGWDSTDT